MSGNTVLALALFAGSSSAAFTNVTHMATATIAFGSTASEDGVNSFFPGSNGGASGVFESFDGGANLSFDDSVGMTAEALILMTAASKGSTNDDTTVLASGLFGTAIKAPGGTAWVQANVPQGIVTQDAKYNAGSGLFSLTGTVPGHSDSCVLSSDGGATFTTVEVPGLLSAGSIRYGSYPTVDTFYVTAGFWGDETGSGSKAARDPKQLSARLSVGEDGALSTKPGDYNTTGAWAQVAKTSDGGATWAMVFEDLESGLYPNDISCWDATTCVFAMEGAGNLQPRIMTTTDGGGTWAAFVDSSGSSSLMTAQMTGPTEAFVAGGGDVGRVWHTTDLATWSASTTSVTDAASFVSLDVVAGSTVAYGTGVLRSQLCSVLKLDL